MILEFWRGLWKLSLLSALVVFNTLASTFYSKADAQIVPDNTLGNESSVVTPNSNVRGLPATLIEGGATRGVNLFQSFSQFNVGDAQRVYFANPTGIENILTRVTGNSVSNIFGTLGVNGNANLFFLNPNGIVFGQNASLDVAGSFFATTADSFDFGNGLEFSTTNPQAAPLLSVSVTPGLQYGANPGNINSVGNLVVGQDLTLAGGNLDLQGQLQASRDLTLQAQDTVKVGTILSPGALLTIEAGNKITTTAEINTSIDAGKGGDIKLTSGIGGIDTRAGAVIVVSGNGDGGNITLSAIGDIFTSDVKSFVSQGGVGNGGNITITSQNGNIDTSGGIINSSGFGSQSTPAKSGDVSLTAHGDITTADVGSYIGNGGIGNGGNVTITSQSGKFSLDNNTINSVTNSFGKGGDIKITAESVSLDNSAALLAEALGQGTAGSISVKANQSISLANGSLINASFNPSNFEYVYLEESSANNIILEANSIDLSGASNVITNTLGSANAGDVNINTQNLTITGGSEVLSQTFGTGKAGNIKVNYLNDKASSSVTFSGVAPFAKDEQGDDIILNENGIPTGGFSSGLFATTENNPLDSNAPTATGSGGNITVNTGSLKIQDGAAISARSRSSGDAGVITIDVNNLEMTGGGQILTPALGNGKAGDINISATSDINVSGSNTDYGNRFQQIQNAFIEQGLTEENALNEAFKRAQFTIDTLGNSSQGGFVPSGFQLSSYTNKDAGNISINSKNGSINL
ncbi:MAG: filamentous hemagglutinin N-terminal domain-containing protein, partial [Richelia sp. RM1_1_1]|nr:filamentous hemagglutinin N-terminal domain-containing protein [Richelia sp. RM1_1_1]